MLYEEEGWQTQGVSNLHGHDENSEYKAILERIVKEKWAKNFLKTTLRDIYDIADAIQEEFGYGCLILHYENISQSQRFALWSFSNIYLNTSLRDGVCLQAQEFVSVKH